MSALNMRRAISRVGRGYKESRGRITAAAIRGLIADVNIVALSGLLLVLANVIAVARLASAQTGGAPTVSAAPNATPAGGSAAVPSPKPSLPTTISSTIVEGSTAPRLTNAPKRHRHKAPGKPPSWVLQSKVQLALQSDPRFKNVRATVTQPGVIVLEGEVFDNDAKEAAEQAAAGVEGVKRVINAVKTDSLQWLLVQNRINQALQQNGFPLVSVKVIGKTAYLSGQVSSNAEKDKAVTIVISTAPEVTIGTNLINVVPPGIL